MNKIVHQRLGEESETMQNFMTQEPKTRYK